LSITIIFLSARKVQNILFVYSWFSKVTSNEETFHVTQLKPFLYDKNRVDPAKIAHKHSDEYIVDTIVSHQGDLNKTDSLKFQVRWKDFSALEDTWEPWDNLKLNARLHEYLISINQAKLIPYELRSNYPAIFTKPKNKRISNKNAK
jgi:hypothetical protein